jgi:hypothetical protein
MTKRPTKRALRQEARESAIERLYESETHYTKLARAEIALGDKGSRTKIDDYWKKAQYAAVAKARYCHARVTATDLVVRPFKLARLAEKFRLMFSLGSKIGAHVQASKLSMMIPSNY